MLIRMLVIATAILAGCGAVAVTPVNPANPRADNCGLDIYTDEGEIKRPYRIVCLIDSHTGNSIFDNRTGAAAIAHARPKACACGADALVVMTFGHAGDYGYGHGQASLKAVRYTDHD